MGLCDSETSGESEELQTEVGFAMGVCTNQKSSKQSNRFVTFIGDLSNTENQEIVL